jgi:hypothetical protein
MEHAIHHWVESMKHWKIVKSSLHGRRTMLPTHGWNQARSIIRSPNIESTPNRKLQGRPGSHRPPKQAGQVR